MFVAFTLLLLWLFQVVFLESFYKSIKVNDVKAAATDIAKSYNGDNIETVLEQITQKNDVFVVVVDETGKLLYSSGLSPVNVVQYMSASSLQSLIATAKDNGGTYLLRFDRERVVPVEIQRDDFQNDLSRPRRMISESILYTKMAEHTDGSHIAIIINANISPVDATVQTIRAQLTYVTLIMLVLALLLALLMAKRISSPIETINRSAKMFAHGRYDVDFNSVGYKEIAELGDTLNFAAHELSKTESLRRELVANISHDLRTPLTMITGYAEAMKDLPGENSQENLQIVIDEANRLASLVSDVLDISKLQSGTETLHIAPYCLSDSIRSILNRYSKLIQQDGYTLDFLYDRDIYVNADELKISQVIYNLVNNAITYTGDDKHVVVRQTVLREHVRVEVIDTGAGIPIDKLDDIWDRYYKLNNEHIRAQIGTGLGLSIVKAILTIHNASYGVHSTPGHGSIFWFELPLYGDT